MNINSDNWQKILREEIIPNVRDFLKQENKTVIVKNTINWLNSYRFLQFFSEKILDILEKWNVLWYIRACNSVHKFLIEYDWKDYDIEYTILSKTRKSFKLMINWPFMKT